MKILNENGEIMSEESKINRAPRLAIIAGATGTGKSTLAHMVAPVSYTHLTLPTTPYV